MTGKPDGLPEDYEERLNSLLLRSRLDARNGVQNLDICGVPVDNLDLRGVLRTLCIRISQRIPGFVVTPNVDHVCRYHSNPEFRQAYENALLSLADGKPVLWAGRLLGKPLRAKLSGSDLVYHLSKFAARRGWSLFLLGAADGVGVEAANRLQEMYPDLRVVGTYSPPVGFEKDLELNGDIIRRLRGSDADICFVALGSPKQEIWMQQNHRECKVPVLIGVGAGLDFVAGTAHRAPAWMQRCGMEWFWRLCHEPRRLWRRYLVTDMYFFVILFRHLTARYRRRGAEVS